MQERGIALQNYANPCSHMGHANTISGQVSRSTASTTTAEVTSQRWTRFSIRSEYCIGHQGTNIDDWISAGLYVLVFSIIGCAYVNIVWCWWIFHFFTMFASHARALGAFPSLRWILGEFHHWWPGLEESKSHAEEIHINKNTKAATTFSFWSVKYPTL